MLIGAAAVREVAAGDDELRFRPLQERVQGPLDRRRFSSADVQVRDVEEAGRHRRIRLYTQIMAEESTEIFDDLYLGLRAGGALRKKRRGEPLTMEEEEALGRWQRLSKARKAATVGAFALGTFGLGFTLGGLVFGRWRKA